MVHHVISCLLCPEWITIHGADAKPMIPFKYLSCSCSYKSSVSFTKQIVAERLALGPFQEHGQVKTLGWKFHTIARSGI